MNDLFKNDGAGNCQSEAIKLFNFKGSSVRVVQDDKEDPWFVAKDVAEILGYRMASDLTRRLDEDERDTHQLRTPSGIQKMSVINEGGLYSAILRSEIPEAKAFKRWVTHELLPEIRKTGAYVHATPEMDDAEIMARGVLAAQRTIERQKEQLREQQRLLQEQAPVVEYCNEVLSATNLHTINSIAVHLGISAIRLNKFLVDQGLIYKQGDIYCPSCKIRGKGYCDFHVVPYINSNGERMTREHLKWTEVGRQFIIQQFNKTHAR